MSTVQSFSIDDFAAMASNSTFAVDDNCNVLNVSPEKTFQRLDEQSSFLMLIHESERPRVKHRISAAFEQPNQPIKFTCLMNTLKRPQWFEFLGELKQFSGTPVLCLSAENITDEKGMPSKHDQLASPPDDITNQLSLGHWHLDLKNREYYWSEEVYHIHGVCPEDYVPNLNSTLDFCHPDDLEQTKKHLNNAICKGRDYVLTHRIICPNGEIRQVLISCNAKLNSHGIVESLYGTFQDLTDSSRINEERKLLSLAAENTTAGIVITNTKKEVMWVNRAFETITGYKQHEVISRKLGQYLQGPDTDPETAHALRKAISAGQSHTTEILNYSKSGKPYWNRLVISPIYDGSEITHFVGVQHDVTEEVTAKAKLQEMNQSLEKMVMKRTAELEEANAKLAQVANTDPLTGCLNRRTLYEQLHVEIKRAERNHQPLSMVLIDVDHFKQINDTFGHQVGDDVLKFIVTAISKEIRDTDLLFRTGGEEFLLLMPNTNESELEVAAKRIRVQVSESGYLFNGCEIHTSISAGALTHDGSMSQEKSLHEIDKLMYQAKNAGRNCVFFHHDKETKQLAQKEKDHGLHSTSDNESERES